MPRPTPAEVEVLYDHLLDHPFFHTHLLREMGITANEDVSENGEYAENMTMLIDQVLVGLIKVNASGREDS